jgi:hypothetical protein
MKDTNTEKDAVSNEKGDVESAAIANYSEDIEKREGRSDRSSSSSSSDDDNDSSRRCSSSSSRGRRRPSLGSRRASSRRSQPLSRIVSEVRDGIESRRDLELGPPLETKVTTTAPDPPDPDLVTWTGPDDPENPKNWTFSRKWLIVFIVSTFTLISPLSSSMVAPSLTAIGDELGVSAGTEQAIVLSIFVLAYAVGPLA